MYSEESIPVKQWLCYSATRTGEGTKYSKTVKSKRKESGARML